MKLFDVSPRQYKTFIYPRTIEQICNCYNAFKFKHGRLVLWTSKNFFTYGNKPMEGFISGGRIYCNEAAKSMGELKDISKSTSLVEILDETNQYLIMKSCF